MTTTAKFLTTLMLMLVALSQPGAAVEDVIFRFNYTDGAYPISPLLPDGKGNFFGTALGGNRACSSGCGVVYELSPDASGSWAEKVIFQFNNTTTGSSPAGGLIFDKAGNLYGELNDAASGQAGVFELSPGSNGSWTEKIIYSFTNQQGFGPGTQLAFDSKGNLYGTLRYNGPQFDGSVFELSPQANVTWTETSIYAFSGSNGDGASPDSGVVVDSKGNLFGNTEIGGAFNDGTVFELSPNGNGGWTETVIYSFTGQKDGGWPVTPLTMDAEGNLYGTTLLFGANYGGVAFEISPTNGKWTESTLYSFNASSSDGYYASGLVFDSKGNLYGTTQYGGNGCNRPGCGIAFSLNPQSGGVWNETILHPFESIEDGSESDIGQLSAPELTIDSSGHVYGVTPYGGGRYGYGTIFRVQP